MSSIATSQDPGFSIGFGISSAAGAGRGMGGPAGFSSRPSTGRSSISSSRPSTARSSRPSSSRHRPSAFGGASGRAASPRPSSALSISAAPWGLGGGGAESVLSGCESRASSRPSSAPPGGRPSSAGPAAAGAVAAAPYKAPELDLASLHEVVGQKVAQRFSSIRELLRFVDSNKDGRIDRGEIRRLIVSFNLKEEQGDMIFDTMDVQGRGEVSYEVFARAFGHFARAGSALPEAPGGGRPMSRDVATRQQEAEAKHLLEVIGAKAQQRFKSPGEAFRFLDAKKDGVISAEECKRFVMAFGFAPEVGEKLFRFMCSEDSSFIDFKTFVDKLGPFILPGYGSGAGPEVPGGGAPPVRSGSRPASAKPSSAGGGGLGRAFEAKGVPIGPNASESASTVASDLDIHREADQATVSAAAPEYAALPSRSRTFDSSAVKRRMSPLPDRELVTTSRSAQAAIEANQDAFSDRPAGVPQLCTDEAMRMAAAPLSARPTSGAQALGGSGARPSSASSHRRPLSARVPTPAASRGGSSRPSTASSFRAASSLGGGGVGGGGAPAAASALLSAAFGGAAASANVPLDFGLGGAAEEEPTESVAVKRANGAVVLRRPKGAEGAKALTSFPLKAGHARGAKFRPGPGGGGGCASWSSPGAQPQAPPTPAPFTVELMNSLGTTWTIL